MQRWDEQKRVVDIAGVGVVGGMTHASLLPSGVVPCCAPAPALDVEKDEVAATVADGAVHHVAVMGHH